MSAGYFLGLWLGFGLIILGIEFYYFILSRYIEKDLGATEAIISIPGFVLSIFLFIRSFSSDNLFFYGFISLLPLPLSSMIFNAIVSSKEKMIQKISEEKDLKDWLYTIQQQPENVNAYISAGDIYFNRKDYEKAIELYRKAWEIMEMPYIIQRIKTAEKELKIQKGIIWVCPECSYDNPQNVLKCNFCGYTKVDKNLCRDIRHNKNELIRAAIIIAAGPLAVIFVIVLYIVMPLYLALIFTLIIIYLTIRFFITY